MPGERIELFKQGLIDAGIGTVFLHAIYLINLGTSSKEALENRIDSLINYMNLTSEVGAQGVIVRPGSHGGKGFEAVLPQVLDALQIVLDASPEGPVLALENMAGMGQYIGAKFEDLADILKAVGSSRLKMCLDTQHAFAAGYDLTDFEGIRAMVDELDGGPGCTNGVAVHATDSKRVRGSGVDRHDNIGDGFIGNAGFAAIMGNIEF